MIKDRLIYFQDREGDMLDMLREISQGLSAMSEQAKRLRDSTEEIVIRDENGTLLGRLRTSGTGRATSPVAADEAEQDAACRLDEEQAATEVRWSLVERDPSRPPALEDSVHRIAEALDRIVGDGDGVQVVDGDLPGHDGSSSMPLAGVNGVGAPHPSQAPCRCSCGEVR